ncbi:hypothetical protein [Rufibacter quisquiliarum]|uniref:DUF4174 domain-containing protein n=1 Tax=Rufibacter quisquiliarum TaxID=1549639 RepID=A0A839GY27_9BACT|nr:hypothetical protein [Rufibacter quisquiliarum]MBA9079616.1 hypothetical protein [Rufibacter quisquiliarum]
MKPGNLVLFVVFIFSSAFAFAQEKPKEGGLLLDQHDKPISKEAFLKLIDQPDIMLAKNDSLPIYKAVGERSEKGQVENYEKIISTLTQANIAVDRTKPLVIIYYPGKDACNSSGSGSAANVSPQKDELTRRTQKIANVNPVRIYRTYAGLENKRSGATWHKDPEQVIEKTFFKYHYPCGSYVILAPNGKYISYFGEFMQEQLLKELKEIMKGSG